MSRQLFRFFQVVGIFLLLVSSASAVPRDPTNEEVALLVFANEARSYPASDRNGPEPIVTPMIWYQGLGDAAIAHSNDMAANQNRPKPCFQHNSCNGTSFQNRLKSYYSGWSMIGENISYGGSDPRAIHNGWMGSAAGHRSNILHGSFNEFGAGLAFAQTNFGQWALATEDFGSRGLFSLTAYPTIVAATVIPSNYASPKFQKDFLLNYYHYNGAAPQTITALVGNICISNFAKTNAAAANWATYKASRLFSGDSCVPVVFETLRSDGKYFRYPATGSILVGVGSATGTCARYSAQVPTATCGLNPGGTPGGGENPTPPPSGQSIVPTATVSFSGKFTQRVQVKFETKENGAAKAGIRLAIKISKAKGLTITRTLQTNKKGVAYFKRGFKRKTEAGPYNVLVTATRPLRSKGKVRQVPFGSGASTQFSITPFGQ